METKQGNHKETFVIGITEDMIDEAALMLAQETRGLDIEAETIYKGLRRPGPARDSLANAVTASQPFLSWPDDIDSWRKLIRLAGYLVSNGVMLGMRLERIRANYKGESR